MSVLVGAGWPTRSPGRFTAGKESRYPLHWRLGGPRGRSGCVRKISPPPGFESRTMQPVVSREYWLRYSSRPSLFLYWKLSFLYPVHQLLFPPREEGGWGKRCWCTRTQTFSNQLYDSQLHCAKKLTGCSPRSVYECFLQLHLFNMRKHVFAVTYLKHFKSVIIHCVCRRCISPNGTQQWICEPKLN